MVAPAVQPTLGSHAFPPVPMRGSIRPPADDRREPLTKSLPLMGAMMTYPRNNEIFGEGEPAEFLYRVISGCVRTCKILTDGRRQIDSFYLPGEIFGLTVTDKHTLSAEAVTGAKVIAIKRSALNALADRDSAVARALFMLTGRELGRAQNRMLLLIKSAQERVADFLLEMADRVGDGNEFDLPMSRQDIADYLGLRIETVSRTLSALETAATIWVANARIVLRHRPRLCHLIG